MADPTIVCSIGEDPRCGIQKKVVYPGKGPLSNFPDGTKVTFHYQTRQCDDDQTILDDSRKGTPMELIMGKKFKLEVWETCLKSMRLGEVATFTCHGSLIGAYPMVAKSLRDIAKGKTEHQHHCCGLTIKEHGLGYPDLDKLMNSSEPLQFTLEALKIEHPGEYNKETWAMDVDEKSAKVPMLREEGNKLYREGKFEEAAQKYATAIGMIEQLMLREKPGDELFIDIENRKWPLLLNYSQCLLLMKDYYAVIEHTSEILKKDPDNVKALFRRAKAYKGAWDPSQSKADFIRVSELDSSLKKTCQKDIKEIEEMEKAKEEEDKSKLKGKLFK